MSESEIKRDCQVVVSAAKYHPCPEWETLYKTLTAEGPCIWSGIGADTKEWEKDAFWHATRPIYVVGKLEKDGKGGWRTWGDPNDPQIAAALRLLPLAQERWQAIRMGKTSEGRANRHRDNYFAGIVPCTCDSCREWREWKEAQAQGKTDR